MAHPPRLEKLLKTSHFPAAPRHADEKTEKLQLEMLRIQQGVFHAKKRVMIAFEGFDSAGKGGAIRRLTEKLDPRGIAVHPIGPPLPGEQEKHWLYRFWTKLPEPGVIAIFDRTWYGRVLVERVEKLTPKDDWKRGYREIREFEEMLVHDGIDLVKIFIGISKEEQLKRFKERLADPYKQWKLTPSDVAARKKWNDYVAAVDDAFDKTHTHACPWHLVPGNHKDFARLEVLKTVTDRLRRHGAWMEKKAQSEQDQSVKRAMKELGIKPP